MTIMPRAAAGRGPAAARAFRMAAPAAPRIVLWTRASSLQVEERRRRGRGRPRPPCRARGRGRAAAAGRSGSVRTWMGRCGAVGRRALLRLARGKPARTRGGLRGGGRACASRTKTAMVWPSDDGHAVDGGGDAERRRRRKRRSSKRPRILRGSRLDLLFLAAADVGDDVVGDVQGGDARDSRRPERAWRVTTGRALDAEGAVQRAPAPWPGPPRCSSGW